MGKEVKVTVKMLQHEAQKLSKREKKALADANWVGKGESRPPVVFGSKKVKKVRENVQALYRKGAFD